MDNKQAEEALSVWAGKLAFSTNLADTIYIIHLIIHTQLTDSFLFA